MDSLGVARLILIVANTINNTDISGLNGLTANIDGTYILQKLLSATRASWPRNRAAEQRQNVGQRTRGKGQNRLVRAAAKRIPRRPSGG
jgi:hypothetical protein